jgi:hypothetical protein
MRTRRMHRILDSMLYHEHALKMKKEKKKPKTPRVNNCDFFGLKMQQF